MHSLVIPLSRPNRWRGQPTRKIFSPCQACLQMGCRRRANSAVESSQHNRFHSGSSAESVGKNVAILPKAKVPGSAHTFKCGAPSAHCVSLVTKGRRSPLGARGANSSSHPSPEDKLSRRMAQDTRARTGSRGYRSSDVVRAGVGGCRVCSSCRRPVPSFERLRPLLETSVDDRRVSGPPATTQQSMTMA